MIGAITAVNRSKSGKALRITLNGKVYNAFLDSGLDGAVGKVIDAQITPDKGYGEGIGQWAYSTQATPPQASNTAPRVSAPQQDTPTSRLSEPELRFVSNCVASAITAKTLTDPMEVSVWAKAAAAAVKEL